MFSTDDTIVAIATPPGRGGLGVVRLSGPDARTIAERLLTPFDSPGTGTPGLAQGRPFDSPGTGRAGLAQDTPPISLAPRHATLATIGAGDTAIDQVVVTFFSAPHSYTGDDVVEISAHGSPVILRQIVDEAMRGGARLAEPGEFTFRGFLNGRIDLVQAEAVADLVDAVTPLQARAAFDQLQGTLTGAIGAIDLELFDLAARLEASIDFPEEGFHFITREEAGAALQRIDGAIQRLIAGARRGRLIREGAQIAIAGKPNVGKSTLFNRLVGADRTIVSRLPGTTRDAVVEQTDLGGVRVTLVDTAGIRGTRDEIEAEGVARARKAIASADLTLVVLDRSRRLDEWDDAVLAAAPADRRQLVINKADLPSAWTPDRFVEEAPVTLSLVGDAGDERVDAVRQAVLRRLDREAWTPDPPAVTNVRHAALLERAHDSVARASAAIASGGGASEELILFEIAEARHALEEVSGKRTPDDVLRHIFERFCIGK